MERSNSQTDDFSQNLFSVLPFQNNRPDVHVTDGDKAGATLLFSGIFLGLVGITFTVMGWIKREGVQFEWTQLLGPVLLSVGVTFALISVCKFKMLTCKSCKRNEETTVDTELPTGPQSFVFTGINQPITFHGATVVQYIPPPYTSQDGVTVSATSQPSVSTPNNSPMTNGSSLSPPQYYSIYPMDNPAFVDDGASPVHQPIQDEFERLPDAVWLPEEFLSINRPSDPPPPYEEIFPAIT